jgi:hypothetical protein
VLHRPVEPAPQQRTCGACIGMSVSCQHQTFCKSTERLRRFRLAAHGRKQEFDIGFRPLNLDPLCNHLFELLKADLGKNPMVSELDRPNKIGFR